LVVSMVLALSMSEHNNDIGCSNVIAESFIGGGRSQHNWSASVVHSDVGNDTSSIDSEENAL